MGAQAILTTLNFCRPGSLGLTRRHWTKSPAWEDAETRTIDVSLGLAPPLTLGVRKFVPAESDVIHRSWPGPDGTQRTLPLAPYAVANPAEARLVIERYVRDNYAVAVYPATNAGVVKNILAEAGAYYRLLSGEMSVEGSEEGSGKRSEEFRLMDAYFRLGFGIRCGMRTAWVSGPETLGMSPIEDPACPLHGLVPVPRQVVETVGCILEEVAGGSQHEFLGLLASVLQGRRRESFYGAFLVLFGILEGCEDISRDRHRYARENFKTTRFDQPDYVKRLHANANVLLGHWHEYVRYLGISWTSREAADEALAFLSEENRDIVLAFYDAAQQTGPITLGEKAWAADLWFCAQIVEGSWAPRTGYDALEDGKFDAERENAAWGERAAAGGGNGSQA